MAAVGNIVINDGQDTPAAHTFTPSVVDTDVGIYHDRSGGIVVGYPELSFGQKLPGNAGGSIKQTLRVIVPILETVTGSTGEGFAPKPTLAYKNRLFIEAYWDQRSSLAERKDVNAFAKNALASTVWTNLVQNFEMAY